MLRHLILIPIAMFVLTGCVELTLAWADLKPNGEAAEPALPTPTGPDKVADWETRIRPDLQERLQAAVFGYLPSNSESAVKEKRLIDGEAFEGNGRLEEWAITVSGRFGEETFSTEDRLKVQVLFPTGSTGPHGFILMQTFCPAWSAMPHPGVTKPDDAQNMGGPLGAIATYVFGRFICTPPIETILDAGYGIAIADPSAFVPDRSAEGLDALMATAKGHADPETRWGAIAAWGWLYARIAEALESDPRVDPDAVIAWGHSRYAKAALVGAAFDPYIDGVIAHQSGTGGASLNWDKPGESVSGIIDNYPHWFAPAYADLADASEGKGSRPSVDQHMLLALIAPRPVLLGNARRDVWSDPNGGFRAGLGANAAYQVYDEDGLTVERLSEFDPSADIAFWMRPGTHGVVEEDWPAFLEFLREHFPRTSDTPSTGDKHPN